MITAEQFAEIQIASALNLVGALAPSQVTNQGNQRALQNFLNQVITALQAGDVATAVDKLNKSLDRTDGWVLRGRVDGNGPGRDWVTDCASQQQIYDLLDSARQALSP